MKSTALAVVAIAGGIAEGQRALPQPSGWQHLVQRRDNADAGTVQKSNNDDHHYLRGHGKKRQDKNNAPWKPVAAAQGGDAALEALLRREAGEQSDIRFDLAVLAAKDMLTAAVSQVLGANASAAPPASASLPPGVVPSHSILRSNETLAFGEKFEVENYGSWVQGTSTKNSDADMCVVLPERRPEDLDEAEQRRILEAVEDILVARGQFERIQFIDGNHTHHAEGAWVFGGHPDPSVRALPNLPADIMVSSEAPSTRGPDDTVRKMMAQSAKVRTVFFAVKAWYKAKFTPGDQNYTMGYFGLPTSVRWASLYLEYCVRSGLIDNPSAPLRRQRTKVEGRVECLENAQIFEGFFAWLHRDAGTWAAGGVACCVAPRGITTRVLRNGETSERSWRVVMQLVRSAIGQLIAGRPENLFASRQLSTADICQGDVPTARRGGEPPLWALDAWAADAARAVLAPKARRAGEYQSDEVQNK